MYIDRIPVYLVTGFLGSGKTTLLCRWLREPALKNAAVIVNEIGEVGYDDQLIAAASDTPSLIANACVCCTGLPGLEEALESLFWARLERRMPAFASVVIETTGLADPGPVIAAFEHVALLKERYHLAGVLTTLSATASDAVLTQHAEARAQVEHADVLVITKTDLSAQTEVDSVRRQLQRANSDACVLTSAEGDLDWESVLQALDDRDRLDLPTLHAQSAQPTTIKDDHVQLGGTHNIERDQNYTSVNFEHALSKAEQKEGARGVDTGANVMHRGDAVDAGQPGDTRHIRHSKSAVEGVHSHAHDHAHDHGNAGDHSDNHAAHTHDAITTFVVVTDVPDRPELVRRLAALTEDFGDKLLRVKGWVHLDDGTDVSVQISLGNRDFETSVQNVRLSTISGRRSGLTVISRGSPARAGIILSIPA